MVVSVDHGALKRIKILTHSLTYVLNNFYKPNEGEKFFNYMLYIGETVKQVNKLVRVDSKRGNFRDE